MISPDGTHFAYWGFGQTLRYDYGCDCSLLRLENFVRYGDPRSYNEPSSQGYGQGDAAYLGWLGNNQLMMSRIGNDGLTKLVWVHTLDQGQNAETEWFTDPGFNGDSVTGMKEGASSPGGDKLAFVVDYMSQSGQATERLMLYTTNGPPPAPPTQRCAFSAPPGGGFSSPSFSPDGNLLAYADGAGIEIAAVANLSDCTTVNARLVAAGGDHPGWGPGPLMPIPGATSTCAGEHGTVLRRCRAKARYVAALRHCARLRTARNRRTCRSRATAAHRRALQKTR